MSGARFVRWWSRAVPGHPDLASVPRQLRGVSDVITRWHGIGADGRTTCGYLIPTLAPTETCNVPPPWKSICTRCRRGMPDGVTGQLSLLAPNTEEKKP